MKTSELRLGNWIQGDVIYQNRVVYGGMPMRVISIFDGEIYADFDENPGDCWEYTEDEIQGVPLTPEVIEKIKGAEVTQVKDEVNFLVWTIGQGFDINESISESGTYLTEINGNEHKLQYLHELQNLYFALYGEELEVTL